MGTIISDDFPHAEKTLPAGVAILRQGERLGQLFVLVSGKVEVIKNDQQICVVKEKGAMFGELSILLNSYQNATVRTLEPSTFHVIEDAQEFFRKLESDSKAAMFLAKMLARRLALLDSHFAELKSKIVLMQAEAAGSVSDHPD